MNIIKQVIKSNYALYNGDSVEVLKGVPSGSIHYTLFSPPFASLYTYSNSDRDMGNSKDDKEFWGHFKFLIDELYRVTMPGRLVSFHCMDIPSMKSRDGFIGIKDFSGDLIKAFQKAGFIYHSRVCIWKDPLIEATRTKALGLLHKQLQKDSSMSRQGLPDYVITMRKPGENPEPITKEEGFKCFYGDNEPNIPKEDITYSHNVWRRYASPVWMDIKQSNTLNKKAAKDKQDERHICPLQLDVIERCIALWTNENDIVLDPFNGIGSTVHTALKMNRRAIGIELKESYFEQSVLNCSDIHLQ